MTLPQDVRWVQRLDNFSRALTRLQEALHNGPKSLNQLEKEGAVQRFEYTLELAWKTLKDYLVASGVVLTAGTPRNVIKDAFSAQLIDNGKIWIDMIDHRNLLSHTYDPSIFEEAVAAIVTRYLPAIEALHAFLSEQKHLQEGNRSP